MSSWKEAISILPEPVVLEMLYCIKYGETPVSFRENIFNKANYEDFLYASYVYEEAFAALEKELRKVT